MQDFTFNAHTKIIFGKNAEENLYEHLKPYNVSGVLLHHSGGSAVKNGLISKIKDLLQAANINYKELSGVMPNPRLSLVNEGIALCKNNNINFILAVGGGSVIDSGKGIALGACDDGDVWDFYERTRTPAKSLPLGVILTIASAGSEGSTASVIKNEKENTKRSCVNELNRPVFAIYNPLLAQSISKYSLATGITDSIMHTLDRYFTSYNDAFITDALSEAIMKTVIKVGPIILNDPTNYEAMASLFWASTLSHNDLTHLGKPRDMSVHALERGISGRYDKAHPACLAIVWSSWAKYVYKTNLPQFCAFATNVMNIDADFTNLQQTALLGIEAFATYLRTIGMPTSFKEAGINPTDEEINEIVHYAFVSAPSIGTFCKLSVEDAKNILNNAR